MKMALQHSDLVSQNERDVKEKEIVESLRRMRATQAKDKPLSSWELRAIRTKMLLPTWDQSNAVSKPKKTEDGKRFLKRKADWVDRKRDTLMVVASLPAAMAFQAGISPPSGVWQDNGSSGSSLTESNGTNHTAGFSILADNFPRVYNQFLISNTTGFLASLSIILLLVSGLPLRHRFFMWVLMVIIWVAITAMANAYLCSLVALTPDHENSRVLKILKVVSITWTCLMLLLLLGHTIRLMIRLFRSLDKLVIRLVNVISRLCARA